MPLYRLPLEASIRPSSRAHLYPRTSKKRKRSSSPHVEFAEDLNSTVANSGGEESPLPAKPINPLSLTPDEILQYRVAGLDLDQDLPSKSIPGFPHRPVPASFNTDAEVPFAGYGEEETSNSETEGARMERKAPFLRIQHLSVLNTILHRCLLEGDIPRASRAWSLLLRAQVNGKGVDIRGSGYWGIGAELLVRSEEKPVKSSTGNEGSDSHTSESGKDDLDIEEETTESNSRGFEDVERRWGTEGGLEKVKDYYERLILQYPYKRQFHTAINPLDFYPAMFSCEIYGIQFSQKENLIGVDHEERFSSPSISEVETSDEGENSPYQADDSDVYYNRQRRKEFRKKEKRREYFSRQREEIRQVALSAAEKVAAKMDDLMTLPPYSDSSVLRRLRGMIALYIGDLSVPTLPDGDGEENLARNEDDKSMEEREFWGTDRERVESRLVERRKRAEHERGLARREEEIERANLLFEKVRKSSERIIAGPRNV